MNNGRQIKSREVLIKILPYALLLAAVITLYWKSLGFDFITSWDDDAYVINNILIQSFSLANLKAIFTQYFMSNYAPLHLLSYSVDYFFWGLNPEGYHLTNIILHAINVLLAFVVIKRISKRADVAFIASLLYAVHPINVENVAWVSERKTLLSAFFTFLAFLSYLNFRERGGRISIYVASALLFVLAMLSKPTAVTLPLALMAYELFIDGEKRWKYSIPFFAISLLGVLTVFAQANSNSIETGRHAFSTLFGTVYPTMLPIYWKYIGALIWPLNLSGFYDAPYYHSFLNPVVLVSLLGWFILTLAVLLKGSNRIRFWYLWFWIWFLPVSNIIPIPIFYADRYMYMPAIGFFVLFAMLVVRVFGEFAVRVKGLTAKRALGYCVVAAVIAFYGITAFNRLDVWHDELAFWEDTVKKSPDQFKPHVNLGYAYDVRGRFIEAERQYEAAERIYPGDKGVLENLRMVRLKAMLKYGRYK